MEVERNLHSARAGTAHLAANLPTMVRLIGGMALLLAAFLLLGGLYTIYVFEKDPYNYAEGSCPAPPDGVDSAERQACLREYQQRTGFDVAGRWLLAALVLGVAGTRASVIGRDEKEPWSAPERSGAEN